MNKFNWMNVNFIILFTWLFQQRFARKNLDSANRRENLMVISYHSHLLMICILHEIYFAKSQRVFKKNKMYQI